MKPLIQYYGAKWNLSEWIISYFPDHQIYIEPCGGSGAVLLKKKPAKVEIYNDIDKELINLFRVVRDRPDEFKKKLDLTLYAREELEIAKNINGDSIEKARRYFVGCWLSVRSLPRDTSFKISRVPETKFRHSAKLFRDAIEHIKEIADRLKHVVIECKQVEEIIEYYYHKENVLFYLDPPYVLKTRSDKNCYYQEWTNEKHIEISRLLNESKASVIISGYHNELYQEIYINKGWNRVEKKSNTLGGDRIESLYLSPGIKINNFIQESLFFKE